MIGATCCSAVLYITNVMWTALGQGTGICVLRPELLYTLNCHYTKILDFSFKYINQTAVLKVFCKSAVVSFCKSVPLFCELCTILTEEMYNNVYCAVVLVLMEAGNEHAMEILRATEREM